MNDTDQNINEQQRQEDLQRLRGFRPIDDTFMRSLFRENIPLAQLVLRIVTGKEDLILTEIKTQADMSRVTGARSICLDAYGTDSVGKKYDMEIQRSIYGADPHRARYHSSVLDVENLDEGHDFKELPDTYIIFITEKDFFKEGAPVYHIQNMNLTTGKPFDDGAHILYVNGEYRGDDAVGKLMHDFSCTDADDMNYDLMAEKTRYLKENPEGVSYMCQVMDDLRMQTEEKTMLRNLSLVMNKLKITAEQAIALFEVPEKDKEKYLLKLNQGNV